MKVFAKYVTLEAVKNKRVFTLLFLDWIGRRGAIETAKMHGFDPLLGSTESGSKGVEMALEDINAETLKSEFGAMIPHDFMLDGDDFTNHYKESEAKDND